MQSWFPSLEVLLRFSLPSGISIVGSENLTSSRLSDNTSIIHIVKGLTLLQYEEMSDTFVGRQMIEIPGSAC